MWPAFMAVYARELSFSSMGKSGKPWLRLMAPHSCARLLITVKMVVPTWGSLLVRYTARNYVVGRVCTTGKGVCIFDAA